ncbi:MAG: TrbC family F-type conjugative pilus assembly protein [Sulfuricaulis sp.]
MVTARALLLALLVCGFAHAQTPAPSTASSSANADVDAILKKSAKVINNPKAVVGEGWQEHADALVKEQTKSNGATLQQLQTGAGHTVQNALSDAAKTYHLPGLVKTQSKPAIHYRLFVSQSLGQGGLTQAMQMASAHPDMVLSFRGMKPGQTLRDLFDTLQPLLKAVAPPGSDTRVPAVEVNPPAFSEAGVTDAPTLEKLDDDGNRVAIVRGVIDPAWLDTQVADKNSGDLGTRGQVFPIVEEDMLVKLQQAAKNFNYTKWAQKAGKTYWKHVPFIDLPHALQARQRTLDPTVEVQQDIRLPDGKYLAHKGDLINPLKQGVGFHQTVVVFDGTDKAQVEFVAKFVKAHASQKLTLITTGIDRTTGWDGFGALQATVGRAVYLLNDMFQNTFHIEHTPSLVGADDHQFIVTEIPVDQGGGNAQAHAAPR